MSPNASPDHLGSGVHGYLDAHPGIINHVDARSEPVQRGSRQSGEPSLLSMIRASPEDFQRMCEESDKARSTESVRHVSAERRSMLGGYVRERSTNGGIDASAGSGLAGATEDGLHAGAGRGMGNSTTYPGFCDQGIDTKGPFIDRRTSWGLGGSFDTRDGQTGLPGQRGGVAGNVGNGLPYGGFDDGDIDRKGPFLSTRSSGDHSERGPPRSSRAGPSGQDLLDIITKNQGKKPGGSGVAGKYLWEL